MGPMGPWAPWAPGAPWAPLGRPRAPQGALGVPRAPLGSPGPLIPVDPIDPIGYILYILYCGSSLIWPIGPFGAVHLTAPGNAASPIPLPLNLPIGLSAAWILTCRGTMTFLGTLTSWGPEVSERVPDGLYPQ